MDDLRPLEAFSSSVSLCRGDTVPVFPKKPFDKLKRQYLCN